MPHDREEAERLEKIVEELVAASEQVISAHDEWNACCRNCGTPLKVPMWEALRAAIGRAKIPMADDREATP